MWEATFKHLLNICKFISYFHSLLLALQSQLPHNNADASEIINI